MTPSKEKSKRSVQYAYTTLHFLVLSQILRCSHTWCFCHLLSNVHYTGFPSNYFHFYVLEELLKVIKERENTRTFCTAWIFTFFKVLRFKRSMNEFIYHCILILTWVMTFKQQLGLLWSVDWTILLLVCQGLKWAFNFMFGVKHRQRTHESLNLILWAYVCMRACMLVHYTGATYALDVFHTFTFVFPMY